MGWSGRDPLHRDAPFFPCCYAAGWGRGGGVFLKLSIRLLSEITRSLPSLPLQPDHCMLLWWEEILQAALQAMPCRQQVSATGKATLVLSASDIPGWEAIYRTSQRHHSDKRHQASTKATMAQSSHLAWLSPGSRSHGAIRDRSLWLHCSSLLLSEQLGLWLRSPQSSATPASHQS